MVKAILSSHRVVTTMVDQLEQRFEHFSSHNPAPGPPARGRSAGTSGSGCWGRQVGSTRSGRPPEPVQVALAEELAFSQAKSLLNAERSKRSRLPVRADSDCATLGGGWATPDYLCCGLRSRSEDQTPATATCGCGSTASPGTA